MHKTVKNISSAIEYIRILKKRRGFDIFDIHAHPMDVMGVIYPNEYKNTNSGNNNFLKKGVMEFFRYGVLINLISPFYYKLFPHFVHSAIREIYRDISTQRLIKEMDASAIDKTFLLPVSPWVGVGEISKRYKHDRLFFLYSPDIHNKDKDEILSEIKEYKSRGAVGIKLHPNLQCFKPQPGQNKQELREKLELVYKTAETEKLFLLFHAGKSFYTDNVNPKYGNTKRSRNYALLGNFINPDGSSELFEKYDTPIILAHLGNFGLIKPNFKLAEKIVQNYKNVYFDTAGCSPEMIKSAIKSVSSKRILFGTDALYNKMGYSLYFLWLAAQKNKEEKLDDILENILGGNIKIILNKLK